MASSLRNRLWWSYALLVGVVLLVVMMGLAISLRNSPIFYRQATLRLRVATGVFDRRFQPNWLESTDRMDKVLNQEAQRLNVRLAVVDAGGAVQVDTGEQGGMALPNLAPFPVDASADPARVDSFRDSNGLVWLYVVQPITPARYLIAATPRPKLALRTILRDEVLSPIVRAGAVAVFLAFILALIMARSIAAPLQRMAKAAHSVAEGEYSSLPLEGPREVRELAQAMNDMARQVQTTQQSQRDFVANVSHELKTPLTSIQGFAQAILDGAVQTPQELQRSARVIYDESGRMHRLVLDLLSLARLEGGTANLERQPVDVSAVLRSVADKFSLQARDAQIGLTVDLPPAPAVVGDGDRLAQVFTNLVDNALKFTPAGGRVALTCRMEVGVVVVRVADSGSGIAPEERERIFERFYQADRSRRGGRRGVGLGLPIARQIVLAHGGKIWAESTPGQGSVFVVQLPVVRPNDPTLNLTRQPGA